jgi:hypothetical protein
LRIASLVAIALAAAGCTAIDDFGKFTFGDGGSAGGCTPGCTCLAGDPKLNVPDHCYVAPANGATCDVTTPGPKLTLSGGYTVDTNANPPQLSGPSLTGTVAGSV